MLFAVQINGFDSLITICTNSKYTFASPAGMGTLKGQCRKISATAFFVNLFNLSSRLWHFAYFKLFPGIHRDICVQQCLTADSDSGEMSCTVDELK